MKDYYNELAEILYYKPSIWEQQSRFWPLRAGFTYPKPNYNVGPKRIECYSLHFVRKGKIQLEYEGEQIILVSGDIFCLYPARTYAYRIMLDEEPLEMNWIAIDGPDVEQILARSGFHIEQPFIKESWTKPLQEKLDRMMGLMKEEAHSGMSGWLETQSMLYGIFAAIVQDEKQPREQKHQNWLKQSIDYIDLHASNGISVQQVADNIGIHRAYFSIEFKKHVGVSPMAYMTKVRMDKATLLLLETNTSVTEIAYSLGYLNLFSFTRAFKRYFTIAPTEYRERMMLQRKVDIIKMP